MIFLVGLKLNLSFLCAYWIVNLTCFVGCFWKWTDAFLIDTRTMVHRIRNWRFLWLVLRRVMECSSQRYCLLRHILYCFETQFLFIFNPFWCCCWHVCVVWPQGGWETDESMEQAALRETIEEAGVVGSVEVSVCKHFLSFFLHPK